MADPADLLRRAVDEAHDVVALAGKLGPQLAAACGLLEASWNAGGKLLVCGNGGSCADAMHLAEELVARFQADRRGLAAIALTDPTVLTCCANDFGYDHVFARQVEALGKPGDVLAVLSTSGNSPNVVTALDAAERTGLRTIAFLGKDGGKIGRRCDVELLVPATKAHRIQEGHKLLFHTLCEWADEYAK